MIKELLSTSKANQQRAFWLLLAMHIAGAVGLGIASTRDLFQALTPFNLLLSAAIVLHFQENKTKGYMLFIFLVGIMGYFIELIGVKSGQVFGEYTYGSTLGLKLWDVPLVIGINWILLVYCTGIFIKHIVDNLLVRSILGALIMTALDVLIEPVAIAYDFWSWTNQEVPLQNYVGWFLVAFVMQVIFHKLVKGKNNLVAIKLLYIQVLFFGALNFI